MPCVARSFATPFLGRFDTAVPYAVDDESQSIGRRSHAVSTESPDGIAPLHDLSATALRRALETWPDTPVAWPRATADTRLARDEAPVRAALRELCVCARRHGVRADQLLVQLKRDWRAFPRPLRPRRDGDDVLVHVISLCIQEYYAR